MARWLVPVLVFLAFPVTGSAHHSPQQIQQPCPRGSVAGVIGGAKKCLKTGQRCKRALDRQYHRYGFHCHTGRLTKPPATFYRRLDVGGYRLAISCRGSAAPIVILESGSGTSGITWARTQTRLAPTTRVCYYDRAGLGDSDRRRPAGPVRGEKIVEELHTLLGRAGLEPPYVLGGWSLGGYLIRLYTKRYPGEVLGLVTVDGTPVGLPPGAWPIEKPTGEPFTAGPEPVLIQADDAELAAEPSLGSRPLVVLVRGESDGASPDEFSLWQTLQYEVARLSTSSLFVRADESGHNIQEQASSLTAEAIRQVVAAVRANTALPACSTTPLPRLGGTCLDAAAAD